MNPNESSDHLPMQTHRQLREQFHKSGLPCPSIGSLRVGHATAEALNPERNVGAFVFDTGSLLKIPYVSPQG